MHFLSRTAALEWIKNCKSIENSTLLFQGQRLLINYKDGVTFNMPQSSGNRVLLAKKLCELCRSGDLLIHFTEWSVWQSSEHLPLFYKFRESYGQNGLLMDFPGQLFNLPEELDDAISYLLFAMLFDWNCYLVPADASFCYINTHDEISYLGLSSVEIGSDLCEILHNMQVETPEISRYKGKGTSFIA